MYNLQFSPSPTALKGNYSPWRGVRGVEFVTYSDVINIGLPIGEGLGRSLSHRLQSLIKENPSQLSPARSDTHALRAVKSGICRGSTLHIALLLISRV